MPDDPAKLSIIRKRRKSSLSSELSRRTENEAKRAALEARKIAVLEYVGERIDELIGLLRSEGFKVQRHDPNDRLIAHAGDLGQTAPQQPLHPCSWCGKTGTVPKPDGIGWLCAIHAAFERGDGLGEKLIGQLGHPAKPLQARPPAPVGVKQVIHPNAQDEQRSHQLASPVDMLAGRSNGPVGGTFDDSDETGADQ